MRAFTNTTGRALNALRISIAILTLVLSACGEGDNAPSGTAHRAGVESFTFLDMGRETEVTDGLRDALSAKLGNDAIEHRGIIDLDAAAPGVLREHLPALDALNRALNSPPGERVEHDMIKLMYRYARRKDTPFDYVELLFDPQTRKPLVFRVRFKGDDAGMIESLRAKHGPPRDVAAAGGRALIWQKEGDSLVVSVLPDQFGKPVHYVAVFFTENLQQRVAAEQAQKAHPGKPRPGKSAF